MVDQYILSHVYSSYGHGIGQLVLVYCLFCDCLLSIVHCDDRNTF